MQKFLFSASLHVQSSQPAFRSLWFSYLNQESSIHVISKVHCLFLVGGNVQNRNTFTFHSGQAEVYDWTLPPCDGEVQCFAVRVTMETYIVPLHDVITRMLVSKTMDQGSSLMQPFSKDRVSHMWNHQFDKKATVWQGHTSPIWLISYQLLCQKFLLSENLVQVVDYAFNACFKNITRCCFAILHIISDFDKHGILFFKRRFCECSFSLPSTVNLKQHCWFTVVMYGRGILQKAFINSSATRSLRHYIPCWSAERMKKERNFATHIKITFYFNDTLFIWISTAQGTCGAVQPAPYSYPTRVLTLKLLVRRFTLSGWF